MHFVTLRRRLNSHKKNIVTTEVKIAFKKHKIANDKTFFSHFRNHKNLHLADKRGDHLANEFKALFVSGFEWKILQSKLIFSNEKIISWKKSAQNAFLQEHSLQFKN